VLKHWNRLKQEIDTLAAARVDSDIAIMAELQGSRDGAHRRIQTGGAPWALHALAAVTSRLGVCSSASEPFLTPTRGKGGASPLCSPHRNDPQAEGFAYFQAHRDHVQGYPFYHELYMFFATTWLKK
jgi:hypothetical protein